MKAVTLSALLCLFAFGMGWGVSLASRSASAQVAAPQVAGLGLQGTVVVVSFRSDPEAGASLERPQIREIGDRLFLVGKDIHPEGWSKGQVVWVSVDDIAQMVEFSDAKALERANEDNAL